MKKSLGALALAAAAVLTTGAPAAAAPTYDVKPAALPRGADVRIPHMDGRTIVDGSTRIPVQATFADLLGKAPAGYVVGTHDADFASPRFWLYRTDGTRLLLTSGWDDNEPQLSDNGSRLALTDYRSNATVTRVLVLDTSDGTRVGGREFATYASVLDVEAGRAVVNTRRSGTIVWNARENTVRNVSGRQAYAADLSNRLFASYAKSGNNDGSKCSVLASVSSPSTRIWTSCTQRIMAFNSDASRLATSYLLPEGPGPNKVEVHRRSGALLATYRINGWFGGAEFESSRKLLLEASGWTWTATARCDLAGCVRASRLTRSPEVID
jgi:hypothetical protein